MNAYAVHWKKIANDRYKISWYVDVYNMNKYKELVYYWGLVDFPKPVANGPSSIIMKFKANCRTGKRITLSATSYNQRMGKGKVTAELTPNKTFYPKPNTSEHTLLKYACKYAK